MADTGIVSTPFSTGQALADSVTLQDKATLAFVEGLEAWGSASEPHRAIPDGWRLSTVNHTWNNKKSFSTARLFYAMLLLG